MGVEDEKEQEKEVCPDCGIFFPSELVEGMISLCL